MGTPLRNDDSTLIGELATETISNEIYPLSPIGFGVTGAFTRVSATDPLPVYAPTSIAVTQSAAWNVGITGTATVANAGTFAVQVSASLPAGAATIGAVNLAQYTPVGGRLPVDGSGGTFPVTGALTDDELRDSPVPISGTVTADLGATDNAVLDSIASTLGTIDTDTGSIATSATSIDAKTPALGQALAPASVPVVLTAAQIATLTPPAAISGYATAANQATIIAAVDGVEGLLGTGNTNTAAVSASLDIIKEWDESDRAKTNPIVGHAGVSGGSGSIDAGTQRVVLASNDAGSSALVSMDSKIPALGQALAPASVPVVLTAAQISTITPPAAITGFATAAKQDTLFDAVDGIEPLLGTIDADTSAMVLSLSTMDDWDESNRAAVNTIAGQVGVAAGAGNVSATTQRVVLAADVAPPLHSGASTSAKQDSTITSVDALGTLLTTIDTVLDTIKVDTEAIETAVEAIQAGQLADGHNVTVDNASIAITAAALPLPSGASTAAKQPALGTAGTPSADVLTVQGDPSGTPIPVTGDFTSDGLTDTELRATPVPVSGTVTANIGTVATLATAAKQDTGNASLSTITGHVDGIEGLLTTIDADTGNIATDVDTLASTVATVSSTPLQRVAIFDAADAQITTFGGGTQYTEDAAAAANPVGTALILVREDARAGGLTTGDGDNVAARGNNKGELYVKHTDSIAVTSTDLDIRNLVNTDVVTAELSATDNAVLDAMAASLASIDTDTTTLIGHVDGLEGLIGTTNTNTGNSATALQLLDDTVFTLGTGTYTEATSKALSVAAVRRDADTSAVDTTNEFAPLIVDARGFLKVEAFVGETLAVSLASVPSHAVTNAGVFVAQIDGAALTALQLIDDPVVTFGTTTYTEASTKGFAIAAVRRDANTTLVDTTNELGPLQMNAAGQLKVVAFDSGDSFTVDYATTGSGNATGALRVELANNGTGVISTVGAVTTVSTVSVVTAVTSITNTVTTSEAASGTATLSNVGDETSSTTLIASNANRKGVILYNDSSAICYVKYGSSASSTSFTVKMLPDDYHEVPAKYTGIVTGLWASDAGGSMRVTELT